MPKAKDFNEPAPYVVFVTVSPTKRNELAEAMVYRVGSYRTEHECYVAVTRDLEAMQNTYGGLISAEETHNRKYRIFKSLGWKEITC